MSCIMLHLCHGDDKCDRQRNTCDMYPLTCWDSAPTPCASLGNGHSRTNHAAFVLLPLLRHWRPNRAISV